MPLAKSDLKVYLYRNIIFKYSFFISESRSHSKQFKRFNKFAKNS